MTQTLLHLDQNNIEYDYLVYFPFQVSILFHLVLQLIGYVHFILVSNSPFVIGALAQLHFLQIICCFWFL